MLYIKDSKTGVCQDLANWIKDKEGTIDNQHLYELERIYNEIEDEVSESYGDKEVIENLESEVSNLQENVSSLDSENEKLAEQINKLEDENSALEDRLDEHNELKDKLSEYMSDIKNILEQEGVEVKDVIEKIDNIMDNIDSVLY